MTTTELHPNGSWLDEQMRPAEPVRPPARRVRASRMPAVLSPLASLQAGGGLAALAGVYVTWGVGITMIVGGVATVVLSALREAKKI